jgi:ribosomal-protein-alanine N-acetyltransferase
MKGIRLDRVSLLWADPSAAQSISTIQGELFPEPWPVADVRRLLDNAGAASLIAKAGDPLAIVGYVLAQIAADEAEIISIGVTPRAQRQGIGRALLKGVLRAAQKAEAQMAHLEVASDNRAATALYLSEGFAEVGRRRGYYPRPSGPPVDALRLARKL